MVEFPGIDSISPIDATEGCGEGGGFNPSALSQENAITLKLTERRRSVAQAKNSMREALDNIVQSGAADQMRGYANQAMGKTKLTLGMATQSPHLTLSGLAQIVVGEFQKSIGEAKIGEDENDICPDYSRKRSAGAAS